MHFLIDYNLKIIFGWSAKCGCSHIKKLFWYLVDDYSGDIIHGKNDVNHFPDDIENYITILFIRNPFDRIVSGFLNKYKNEYRHMWKHETITFYDFVNELTLNKYINIDEHHFTPQTSEYFDKNTIMKSKIVKIFDIIDIDYQYIESLFNKTISPDIINFRGGHERKSTNIKYDKPVYNLNIDEYYDYDIQKHYFYNKDILLKVINFYIDDFIFFRENNYNYLNTDIFVKADE
jgi:hypothetical protein